MTGTAAEFSYLKSALSIRAASIAAATSRTWGIVFHVGAGEQKGWFAMKLMIDRGVLLKTLAHAQSVVERRNTIPILSNLKLEVANGKVSVAATDMEIGLTESAMADPASEDGSATAPAHTLYDIVRKLPDGAQVEIALDAMAERLTVRAGRSNFQLSVLPTEDFPSLADGDLPVNFRMAARDLRALIHRPDALCNFDRRDPLLLEWHFYPQS